MTETKLSGSGLTLKDLVERLPETKEEEAFKMWKDLLTSPYGSQISFQLYYSLQQITTEFQTRIEDAVSQSQSYLTDIRGCSKCEDDVQGDVSAVDSSLDEAKQLIKDFDKTRKKTLTRQIQDSLKDSKDKMAISSD